MKNLLAAFALILVNSPLSAASLPETCAHPTLARKPLCDDYMKAAQAQEAGNTSQAKALVAKLKEKVLADDPLAPSVEALDRSLAGGHAAKAAAPAEAAPYRGAVSEDSSLYRLDGWRKRTGAEITGLYSVALGHGFWSGLFVGSFKEGHDSYSSYFGLGGLLGLATGVGTVLLLDNVGEPMRYGVPSAMANFYSWGLVTGLTTGMLHNAYSPHSFKGRYYFRYGWGLAMGAATVGGLAAHYTHMRPGQSATIAMFGNWGAFFGFTTSVLFTDSGSNLNVVRGMSIATVGTNLAAGALGTALVYGTDLNPSMARIQTISLAGSGGALVGLLSVLAFRARDHRAIFGLVEGGAAAGLLLGTLLTSSMSSDDVPMQKMAWYQRMQLALAPTTGGMAAQVNLPW